MTDPSQHIDLAHIARRRGITENELRAQLDTFKRGVPYIELDRPATIGDGITTLGEQESAGYEKLHDRAAAEGRMIRFVPASGAASRMFRQLQAVARDNHLTTRSDIEDAAANGNTDAAFALTFFNNLNRFAFYDVLCTSASRHGADIAALHRDGHWQHILEFVLGPEGLNYADLPKGMILFHTDRHGNARTAFQEQLAETAAYTTDRSNTARVHFTVPARHREAIDKHLAREADALADKGTTVVVTLSEQHPHTDTIAVNPDNTPFVDSNGEVLFRPGGHGALLENLQHLDADIVFIKNIDNVLPLARLSEIVPHKKRLAGVLVETQQKLFDALDHLRTGQCDSNQLDSIARLAGALGSGLPNDWTRRSPADRTNWLIDRLNRPLRVCGMVRNEGEPGGGPFWVRQTGGATSLQIVESAQVDPHNRHQQQIFESATHFNPVDIVCSLRDRDGTNYDLSRFVDPDTALIANKSRDGRDLKALELPGLWNGSMAHWNTVFVEVPAATFNPVKTVNDLLRPAHQAC
jgi:hypothetical protein